MRGINVRARCSVPLLIIAAVIAFTLFVNQVHAQTANTGRANWYHMDEDFEMLSVGTSTAVGFGTIKTDHPESSRVRFRVEDNDIRVRTDGADPTSTVGELVKAGEPYQVIGYENIVNFKAIAITATANLPCTYAVEKTMK